MGSVPGIPGEKRRTAHGTAVRTAEGWAWMCDYCDVQAWLGMAADVDSFDSDRWLESVDEHHHCEHKPESGA